ncbi:uncharacterized protein N0V89_011624 [Didymosphaeria variabile]|uniref:Uncharacterized protein n=1 Tax=Didymosphaeria variabile TaxID=1932322 RepID=A0A9W8XC20_9PLEO|nr:uncharacterized protein N0V89_011624 [Didymosphaeria variabile]KAJ4345492.1 hypothetical protein N0V89_011624 [Didymosphaeria variabile]
MVPPNDVPPEDICRDTKIDMRRKLQDLLCVNIDDLQENIDQISIMDIGFHHIYHSKGTLPKYDARFDLADAIINNFRQAHERWTLCTSTSFLVLKEYADDETRPCIKHEYFGSLLLKTWDNPRFDIIIHVMYPIKDMNSLSQVDYLCRAFIFQLGVAVLEKYYDKELQEGLVKAFDKSHKPRWLAVLKELIAHLERCAIGNQKIRVFVELHGAGTDQTVKLVSTMLDFRCDGLSPIFQFLISGLGADRVAKENMWETVELLWLE